MSVFMSAAAPGWSTAHWLLLALGVLFAALPALGLLLAIDPTLRRPGVGVLINLRTGASSAAGGEIRYLLLGVKNTANGTGTIETLYEDVANADEVGTRAGVGGLTHLAAQRLFEENPTASVDLILMDAPSGNAAAGTITFDDSTPVTVDQVVTATICGRTILSDWFAGETDIEAATRLVSKINAATKRVPVTAANGGGTLAVVTLTAKSKGKWGLDVSYDCELSDGTGGAVTTAAANLTGGTTEPDAQNSLDLVLAREYRLIVPCLSNADLATATTASNMGLIKAHISGNNSGIGALLQTAHTGCTDSTTNAKAMSNQHGFEYFSHHLCRGGQSLPAEWGAAIAGMYGREIRSDANHPFVLAEFKDSTEIYGSADINGDQLTAAEIEDLLTSGVAYIDYTAQRRPRLARPITTYFEDSDGTGDDRVLDVSKVFGMIAVGSDLRVQVQREFRGKKLLPALPSGRTPIPPNIVEEKDAKAFILARLRSQWVGAGVVNGVKLDEVVEDESLIVRVNPTDETQLDVFLPLRIIPPLVKTSITLVQA
jgi:phage tail sheath gpL-like